MSGWGVGDTDAQGGEMASIFEGDVLATDEAWDHLRKTFDCPEKNLLLAVLEDGIRGALGRAKHTRSARQNVEALTTPAAVEAFAWVMGDANGDIFDFTVICDVLDLDASHLRALTLRQRARILRGKSMPPKFRTVRQLRTTIRLACERGHRLVGPNAYVDPSGYVACRLCRREKAAKEALAGGPRAPETAEARAARLRLQAARMRAAKAHQASPEPPASAGA